MKNTVDTVTICVNQGIECAVICNIHVAKFECIGE